MDKNYPPKVLIDTDVIVDYITGNGTAGQPDLVNIMQQSIAFTTVVNASELFFAAKDEKEIDAVRKVLTGLKVLGLHSRYSLSVPKYSALVNSVRDALFCVVADFNKLPIVTNNTDKYSKAGLKIIHPKELRG